MYFKSGEEKKSQYGDAYQVPSEDDRRKLEHQIGSDTDGRRAVGYIRVSKKKADRFDIEKQREIITKYCDEHNLIVCGWYIDSEISGLSKTSPAMNAMLYGGLKSPTVNYIVCARSDRISGDLKMYYYYFMLFDKKGIELVSATEDIVDDGTGLGEEYRIMMLFVAEQERKNIYARTSGGRAQKAKAGGYAGGKTPFGYKPKNGMLVIDPGEAEIVRKIFFLYTHGMSATAITNYLNASGARGRAGTFFSSSTIIGVLKREKFYRGYYRFKDSGWVKGQHEPIFKDDDPIVSDEPGEVTENPDTFLNMSKIEGKYPKVLYKLDNDFAIAALEETMKEGRL